MVSTYILYIFNYLYRGSFWGMTFENQIETEIFWKCINKVFFQLKLVIEKYFNWCKTLGLKAILVFVCIKL